MKAGNDVESIAVSRDGKWIVSGARRGHVAVWDAESHNMAIAFRGHEGPVLAVDISPDGTRFATGSWDKTVRIWLLLTGEQLLRPLGHDWYVTAVKFAPDGCSIATATLSKSVLIYDGHDGHLVVDMPMRIGSLHNHSLAWGGLGRELFALSKDGDIHCIDMVTGMMLSKWAIHSNNKPWSIVLASDSAFIAASANASVSIWNMATHQQIGPLIHHTVEAISVAISANHDLAIGGAQKMILRKLPDILPSSYFEHVCVFS